MSEIVPVKKSRTLPAPASAVGAASILFALLGFSVPLSAQETERPDSVVTTRPAETVDVLPQAVIRVPPVYPADALASGVEGTVYVQATIDEHGRVVKAVAVASDAPPLMNAAAEAVRKWRFSPAQKEGRPVEATIVIPVRFVLEKEKGGE
ncbi:MAG: energy transducer TonB [Bacteroidota bacterium]|nr:energy transducer TonB [Bacteroidota bacterium]